MGKCRTSEKSQESEKEGNQKKQEIGKSRNSEKVGNQKKQEIRKSRKSKKSKKSELPSL